MITTSVGQQPSGALGAPGVRPKPLKTSVHRTPEMGPVIDPVACPPRTSSQSWRRGNGDKPCGKAVSRRSVTSEQGILARNEMNPPWLLRTRSATCASEDISACNIGVVREGSAPTAPVVLGGFS
jgi:hypothetical protein